jgi:hypothetical protein
MRFSSCCIACGTLSIFISAVGGDDAGVEFDADIALVTGESVMSQTVVRYCANTG